ncbi:MAG: phosphoheptose isomerase [Runella slithyformis]|nr:MAG: phosphoheptose isomerase [Runella slithyformis]TAF92876.1 MAG: phosphoheptose isomerase [Runella sp.]TAG23691.1 MAG: phosphoheptose isomerase [Cytophagales bacterium]TAG42932.1 MAG: phosphoheptose isomerase [Cytophagia bacterium]TAF02955.1 MAG: phosphoheptose isomerase [Runella slithyformis]
MNQNAETSKEATFEQIAEQLRTQEFTVVAQDQTRPWGGFFVIDEAQTPAFAARYFPEVPLADLQITQKLSPKILVVAPQKRLSWQYHHRRAEIWRVVSGTVGVVKSDTDQEMPLGTYQPNDLIVLKQGERHRLVGLDGWGVLAEIWQHTDAQNPSDENDIVRVQDDFGR